MHRLLKGSELMRVLFAMVRTIRFGMTWTTWIRSDLTTPAALTFIVTRMASGSIAPSLITSPCTAGSVSSSKPAHMMPAATTTKKYVIPASYQPSSRLPASSPLPPPLPSQTALGPSLRGVEPSYSVTLSISGA